MNKLTRFRQENAKKAKEAADQLFPGEKWINKEEGIYLSPNRPVGKKTSLTKQQIISALYGARNNVRYSKKNKFSGGRIILKIKGQKNLIYLDVDSLKVKKP